MVVRYDNGTGGGRTDFDRPLSFMRIGVDIHREFEETAAFRSLVAKRETTPLSVNGRDGYCGLQHAIHGEEEEGSIISQ